MGVAGQIVERLDAAVPQQVIVYSIVENYPLPMLDYVAVVPFADAGNGMTTMTWEGHYTEGALPYWLLGRVGPGFGQTDAAWP